MVEQVLLNLARNAMQAMDDPTITPAYWTSARGVQRPKATAGGWSFRWRMAAAASRKMWPKLFTRSSPHAPRAWAWG